MNTRLSFVAILLALVVGCENSSPRFRLNFEGKARQDVSEAQQQGLVDALTAAFGEPDEPYVFSETGLDLKKLELAAGPAFTNLHGQRQGLYRLHCAHCHGVSGDGLGPTARFLTPYPRDYRNGVFKFTSTGASSKPTRADLRKTLIAGIPGTAMPSFALLPDAEIDALVEYVLYLSMRGETELLLYDYIVNQDAELPLTREGILEGGLTIVVDAWNGAESGLVVPELRANPPQTPEELQASIEAGYKLFTNKDTKCVNCHGPTGLGDGGQLDYDIWNKPKAGKSAEEIAALWSLPLQPAQPRNLRLGIYRGGRRPVDLYRRIFAGIKGSPMPALGATPANPSGLKPEQIWQLVDFVRSLPYESIDQSPSYGAAAATTAQVH